MARTLRRPTRRERRARSTPALLLAPPRGCLAAGDRSFAALAGLPEDTSRQIEDLVDLQRFNAAIIELADHQQSLEARQGALETSQDQARQAWRDLRAEIRAIAQRIAMIEQQVGGVISREQRGYPVLQPSAQGQPRAYHRPAPDTPLD